MSIEVGIIILIIVIAIAIACILSVNKSKKRKLIVWGLTTMLAIAPLLSWLISISYAISEGSGWAGVGLMWILLPLLLLVGLVLIVAGFLE
ncbi:hypothetical protein ACM26V_15505 [Salipaludibacillus sp. HK11]|uniref:hypothetical protein n=1 Tax=Salipaludibacillus sp. HK11 TaxID=3394320 RepID=UPI0039FBC211